MLCIKDSALIQCNN